MFKLNDYRERLLVSYYRYSGEAGHNSHMDTVCELLRSTGYQPQVKRPANYPETLLARVPVQKSLVTKVGVLKFFVNQLIVTC